MSEMGVRVTLALLAYNQERFIETAVRSALTQVCEPIEIIVSDDASSDGTFAAIERVSRGYAGPHRLRLRRNETNRGIGAHLNALMRIAEGRLVVLMAGDDISMPDRVQKTLRAWQEQDQRPDLIAAHVFDMSEDGHDLGVKRVDRLEEWRSVEDWARCRPYVIGAAHAVTRRLFDRFGPLADDVFHEDQVNTLRAICCGGGHTIDEPLVRYRRGGLSGVRTSSKAFRSREAARNAMHLAMFDQWKRDAAIAGCDVTVSDAIEWAVQREMFTKGLLEAPSFGAQLRWMTGHPEIGFDWRWKRLAQLWMPRTAFVAKRLKTRWTGSLDSRGGGTAGRRPWRRTGMT
jgi:glycosyltransferase involved in cell wall biosynthesis